MLSFEVLLGGLGFLQLISSIFLFYFNSCSRQFVSVTGCFLGKHRKVVPTASERIIWGFGDGSTIPVFQTPIGKIGAAICWENKMPLLRTALYGKG